METFDFMTPTIISKSLIPSHQNVRKLPKDAQPRNENEEGGKVTNLPKVNSVLRDITNSRFADEEEKFRCRSNRWKNEVARERWKILAKALLEPEKSLGRSTNLKDISVRRFATFDLITPHKLEKLENWFSYTARYFQNLYLIEIHHLEPKLTPKELIGFNNTGNICIWPSEEVLTHYILSKLHVFEGKEILEVGGGMACLAGMMLAKYGKVKRVDLTDGNPVSVENVSKIVAWNKLNPNAVAAFQLDWVDHQTLTKTYDVVLSSDCLFFDDTREDLVETIWTSLKDDGVALVMAPRRGNTLNLFAKMAAARGFGAVVQAFYEEIVWKQHLRFLEFSPEYDEDLHYPILLLLTKSEKGTDYWVSQGRKFCEFCKCSIADNKASIQFHENGKKHKNNVAKRLTEMQKKAAKEAKAALDFERELKRMEAAALKSYKNDIQSNADYTSHLIQQGVETLPEAEYVEPASSKPKPKPKKPDKMPNLGTGKKWMEAKTEEGQSYYWNVETKESVWEPPEEGFVSLVEQQNQKVKPQKKPCKPGKKLKKGKFHPAKNKPKTEPKPEPKPEEEKEEKMEFPLPYVPPFGKWKKVEPPKEVKVDLQLPKQEWVEVVVPKIKDEPERSFKEKTAATGTVASFAGETGFKKRKIAQDVKRNMRQRLDDD